MTIVKTQWSWYKRDRKRERRRARRRERAQRRSDSCFWVWPWGHIWEYVPNQYVERCEVCDKEKFGGV